MNTAQFAKSLIAIGFVIAAAGILLYFGGKLGIGRLPGDIYIKRGSFTIYFPIATCILVSVLLTLLFRVLGSLR